MERFNFGREAVRQVQRAVRRSELRNDFAPQFAAPVLQLKVYIAKSPATGIPALSSDTPGSADVTLYRINSDGDLEQITDENNDARNATVYNLSSSAVAANTYIQCKQEMASGKLLVDFEDCG